MDSRRLLAIFSTLLLLTGGSAAPRRYNRSYDEIKNKVSALEALTPQLIQSPPGKLVRLPCTKTFKGSVTWLFKQCGRGLMSPSCEISSKESNISDGSWMLLPCPNPGGCDEVYELDSPREEQSGLYRCMYTYSNQSAFSYHRTIIATYRVQIIVSVPAAPSLIDGPNNETVTEGQTAVLRCRVRSQLRPAILWLRLEKSPPNNADEQKTKYLKYINETYELLKSKDIPESEDIFLSKLVLPRAVQANSGYYICLAINEVSNTNRGAYLHVSPAKDPSLPNPPLPLLFLIPAGLALMPSLLWCFYFYRSRTHKKLSSYQYTSQVPLQSQPCKCNYTSRL